MECMGVILDFRINNKNNIFLDDLKTFYAHFLQTKAQYTYIRSVQAKNYNYKTYDPKPDYASIIQIEKSNICRKCVK